MTEKQPHQPPHQPSYGSTPYDGTQPLPVQGYGAQQSQQHQNQHQQYGQQGAGQFGTPSGPQSGHPFGQSGAYQGTTPAGPQWPNTGQPGAVRADQQQPRRRGLALLATTALLVGAAGGVGGAAAFSAFDDNPGSGGSVTAPLSTDNGAAPAAAPDGSIQKAAANVLPSVVKIGVVTQQGAGSGSGIVISADGLIVTNNHVVEQAAQGGDLTVTLNDGRTVSASIVGRDPLTDLAVIRADAKNLTPAKLGASGSLAVGQ